MVDMNKVLSLHEKNIGVLKIDGTFNVNNRNDLAEAYTPGVADLAKRIEKKPELKERYTISGKLVAIISDGSAVLGLGNVGPAASLPIIEGKALLYKNFANVNVIPLALEQSSVDDIVKTIKTIAPSFAGIHLEDIAAPKVFEIEERLSKELVIPVYHDDQTGTAIVVLAGLINAAKVVNKPLKDLQVVINGIGAAGVATAKILIAAGLKNLTLVDIEGVVKSDNPTYNDYQRKLVANIQQATGAELDDVIDNQDVFIGLSVANVLNKHQVARMSAKPIIFALANPIPEINPKEALEVGAGVVATGSSQWPNQVNNILAFPGLFKGLLASGLKHVDLQLQIEVANALADMVAKPTATKIVPGVFDESVVNNVAQAVLNYAKNKL
ncbi:NAD(P)-dependent malic enzyme [Periweissella beninensis]|uniref:NADP-dependent malic enzyme n=1 Tax=Periweissella beninensis TaxID=504936 RepID=A0ABT0VFJ9_9LACO|nr:NADP-dependent malic enzyme [Periweissella beninensis]MBM7543621.1 malate dehydrogenase (oxaloacetate-decarboxylating) [Periweissella beninensis]MCM2436601.1 NADP-dependent malic enzyme [Periweissella beninensis]MCT4395571.1 NADP-dependent malic enzyme [Periweissella beninensis]